MNDICNFLLIWGWISTIKDDWVVGIGSGLVIEKEADIVLDDGERLEKKDDMRIILREIDD